MKKNFLCTAGAVFLAVFIGYYSVVAYTLNRLNINEVILQCYEPNNSKLPIFPKGLSEFYMLSFRGNKEDIATLQAGQGYFLLLGPAFDVPEEKRYKYANFFFDKGLDINNVGWNGVTILHEFVQINNLKAVEWALEKGANPNKQAEELPKTQERTELTGLTPLQFAIYLKKCEPTEVDRTAIVGRLKKAMDQ